MAQGQQQGLPEDPIEFSFQGWEGVDTKPPRGGVDDKHAFWCDNLMPLGERNLRAMPDVGGILYTAPHGLTIIWHTWFTLTATGSCAVVFLSDGSAVQVTRAGGIASPIAAAGTFAPTVGLPFAFQYGAQYLIMIAEQTNGYWIWDGANLYGAGTLAPIVTITDSGNNLTSPPTISLYAAGSPVSGSLSATISAGAVNKIIVTNPGPLGFYALGEQPLVIFSGSGGRTAYGTIGYGNGVITATNITDGGSGFTSVPTIVINTATGSGASVIVNSVSGGIITGLEIVGGGINYSPGDTLSAGGGGGSGFSGSLSVSNGVLNGYTIVDGGQNYKGQPTVNIVTLGGATSPGTGAAATAEMTTVGTLAALNITSGGSGYNGAVAFYLSGGQGPPSATVQLMPFGIQGSSGDNNGGRVWIASIVAPVKVFFTAPGVATVQDFSIADGAGVFPPDDSHLQYQYTALKSSSGEFLYLIGDSSVDYESGAQTTGTPPVTTFAKLNVDEQIGTVWRDSVTSYGRSIVFANPIGIYTIYGGAVQKISTPFDGVYPSTSTIGSFLPSSAVADVFNVRIYMLLIPIIDPISGQQRNALLIWDGRRLWTATPNATLEFISTREFASQTEAWGTDGVNLFQLFIQPTNVTAKTLLSKYWTSGSIAVEKRAAMLYALWKANMSTTLGFSVDVGATALPTQNAPNTTTPVTQAAFQAASGEAFARSRTPSVAGIEVGFRMTSNSPDFQIKDVMLLCQKMKVLY